ncbi:MAG TPA: SPOR domain-containing protein [Salinivirgaceae bacterium]|nr:SPOR domain-containing protein [Salinivirgaceae bacterium]
MVENYLAELLATNNRVIVPDFGAFMVKIDGDKRIITFNDFLKYNDGLLVNHIAAKENISKEDALTKIKEFIKTLQDSLKTNPKYPLSTLGVLLRDDRGGIRFVPTGETQETAKKEEVSPKQPQAEPKVELKEPTAVKPDPTAASSAGQKPTQQQAKPTVKTGTPPPPPPKPTSSSKPAKKSSSSLIITLAVIVILLVGGGLVYLNWDEWTGKAEKERLADELKKKEQARLDSIAEVERLRADSIRMAEEAAAELQRHKNEKLYYLVAGSFQSERNAQRFAEQLRNQGYPNAEVFMESRGFWRVCYNSYSDRREAFAEYRRLKEQDIQVWVIKK